MDKHEVSKEYKETVEECDGDVDYSDFTEEITKEFKMAEKLRKERSKSDLKFVTTNRGFQLVNFTDYYSQKCSLQESSVVPHLWLGVDTDLKGNEVNNRMHLSQPQVEALIPLLQHFVDNGCLPEEQEVPKDATKTASFVSFYTTVPITNN